MPLILKLKPHEEVVINGCVIKNSDKRAEISVENHADVIRHSEMIHVDDANTPRKEILYLIQAAILKAGARDKLVPHIQSRLANLTREVSSAECGVIFEAANEISVMNYYGAFKKLKSIC